MLCLIYIFSTCFHAGQLSVLRFDGIYQGTTKIFTGAFGLGSMCYNGQDIYYTSASGALYTFQPGSTTAAVHANITTDSKKR